MQTDSFNAGVIVGLGAALGACARHVLTVSAGTGDTTAIVAMLAVNLIGCFAMGYFKPGPFWGAGFLGGFTSYSAVAAAALSFTLIGAMFYILATFALCIAAWIAGDALKEHHA